MCIRTITKLCIWLLLVSHGITSWKMLAIIETRYTHASRVFYTVRWRFQFPRTCLSSKHKKTNAIAKVAMNWPLKVFPASL